METILLVEDAPYLLQMIGEILRESGYSVLEACGAEQALLVSEKHLAPIHLLLTDLSLPGESGVALAKKLVASRPDTRVLFMSGYGDGVLSPDTLSGRFGFVPKPFDLEELARQVHAILHPAEE